MVCTRDMNRYIAETKPTADVTRLRGAFEGEMMGLIADMYRLFHFRTQLNQIYNGVCIQPPS